MMCLNLSPSDSKTGRNFASSSGTDKEGDKETDAKTGEQLSEQLSELLS